MVFKTINIVTPAEGRKDIVQDMLVHLTQEVEKHEPEALEFQVVWDKEMNAFLVFETFTTAEAQEHHRAQPYTEELRNRSRAEHHLAKKVEVHVVEGAAGFVRKQ